MVTHQLQVERRTGKVRRPETDVLPLCHATNQQCISLGQIDSIKFVVASLTDSACYTVRVRCTPLYTLCVCRLFSERATREQLDEPRRDAPAVTSALPVRQAA